MFWWSLVILLLLLGCEKGPEVPVVPPPPEDLSTWTVPELVQPTSEIPPPAPVPAEEKPTAAERVYPFTPGTTFVATVPGGSPLDIVLERGEQVRNIVGGDRVPAEANQTPR